MNMCHISIINNGLNLNMWLDVVACSNENVTQYQRYEFLLILHGCCW